MTFYMTCHIKVEYFYLDPHFILSITPFKLGVDRTILKYSKNYQRNVQGCVDLMVEYSFCKANPLINCLDSLNTLKMLYNY